MNGQLIPHIQGRWESNIDFTLLIRTSHIACMSNKNDNDMQLGRNLWRWVKGYQTKMEAFLVTYEENLFEQVMCVEILKCWKICKGKHGNCKDRTSRCTWRDESKPFPE